jgi:long-subunit fatty acid transport protein
MVLDVKRIKMINKIKTIIIFFTFVTLLQASSSKFGLTCNTIGSLYIPYSTAGQGRSFEIASTDSFSLNARNFSMWSNVLNSTFTIGLDYNLTSSNDGKTNDIIDEWYLQNILIAAPIIHNKLAFGIGVQPVTQMEQHVQNLVSDEFQEIDEYMHMHGGFGRGFLNISYQIISQFGIGISYEYYFGNMQKDYKLEISKPVQTSLAIDVDSRTSGSNFSISANATPFSKLKLGFVMRPKMKFNVSRVVESNSAKLNEKTTVVMDIPAEYNIGMQYTFSKRWLVGADAIYQDWGNGFTIDGFKKDDMEPYYRVGIGFERNNSGKEFDKYYRKIIYRGGLFYDQKMYRSDQGHILEYGLSMGVTFPLIWNRSKFEFSAIVGRRGNLDINRYEEMFVNFGFSITVGEVWFKNPEE